MLDRTIPNGNECWVIKLVYSHVVCYLPITTQQATPKLSGLKMSTLIIGFEGWELGVTQRLPVAQGFSGGLAGLWAGLWP